MTKIKKELRDCFRFFFRTTAEEKRIVFYSEYRSYCSYFEGAIRELLETHKAPLCYVTSDFSDPILQSPLPIRTFYVHRLLPLFMLFLDARVCVMTLTDLNKFHLRRSMRNVHYVYIFHSLISTHMQYREGAFDHYDTILCAGPHHMREIRQREEMINLPKKNLVPAGYYRVERVKEAFLSAPLKLSSEPKVVLVAPSWGKQNILEACGASLVRLLIAAGHHVTVRPHPETMRRSPELIANLEDEFGRMKGFILEKSVAGFSSLVAADVLITDWSGVAFEYAFGTERPVVFLDVPKKVNNPSFETLQLQPLEVVAREKIGIVISPTRLEEVIPAITKLVEKREEYHTCIRTLRSETVYELGSSSRAMGESIMSLARSL